MSTNWCFKCRDICLTHKCNKHGEEPVFHHSHKLRVPKFKNKAKFRKFLFDVKIFFNCVTAEQKPYLDELCKDLKITGKKLNGRTL